MTRNRTTALAPRTAVAALVLTIVAACSADTPPAGDTSPPADAVAIEVSAVEFAFSVSDLPVDPGTYTFTLRNDGSMSHNLVLEGPASGSTRIIGPGETDSFTVELGPGDYTFYCSVSNHRAQGMEVTFTVS